MERYLQQLIEDMHESARHIPDPSEMWTEVDKDNPCEIEDMAHVEKYLYGTPQKLSEIVKIEKIFLPPPEKLTEKQATLLYMEMVKLLEAFHFVPEFPEHLPYPFRYRILRENWESEHVFIGGGFSHLEFCTNDSTNCPFPAEYCSCLKFEQEEGNDMTIDPANEEDLPF